jgi:dGTPase
MFQTLFQVYSEQLETGTVKSEGFQQYLDGMKEEYRLKNTHTRIVLDYIAGMTDHFFNYEFQNLVLPRNFGRQVPITG